jgi:hypothetical protein
MRELNYTRGSRRLDKSLKMPRWIDSDWTFRIRLSFHRHAVTRALIIRAHAKRSLSRSCYPARRRASRFEDGGARIARLITRKLASPNLAGN